MFQEDLTYGQFVLASLAYHRAVCDEQRFGQAVYNCLVQNRPDIASLLTGTPLDPFYRDFVTEEVWEFIESKW